MKMHRHMHSEAKNKIFIERLRSIYGDKYDFSHVEYKGRTYSVTLICPTHGPFSVRADVALRGKGCRKCAHRDKMLESFLEKAKKAHADKYEYDMSSFIKFTRHHMRIKCPEHGWFSQEPAKHVAGQGCPKCSRDKKRLGKESIIKKFVSVHGNRYDYTFVDYKTYHTKVKVVCKQHGPFLVTPSDHVSGRGCPRCGRLHAAKKRRRPLDTVKSRLDALYDGKVSIVAESYKGTNAKALFVCAEHGQFRAHVNHVLNSHGCPQCGRKKLSKTLMLDQHEVVERMRLLLPSGVQFDPSSYSGTKHPMKFFCPKCGIIRRTPDLVFSKGFLCRCYRHGPNKFEQDVMDYLQSLGFEPTHRANNLLAEPCSSRHEIDLYVESCKLGIECHGAVWHSSLFRKDYTTIHRNKRLAAEAAGIDLIQIFDFEWGDKRKQPILKDIIRRRLGVPGVSVGARSCTVYVGPGTERLRAFMRNNHLQKAHGSIYAWLEYEGSVLAALSVIKGKNHGEYVVARSCSAIGYNIPGGFPKLLKALYQATKFTTLVFFVDRRIFSGRSLKNYGFSLVGSVPPRYVYINKSGAYVGDRRTFQRSKILKKYPHLPPASERELTEMLGLARLYDAGKDKYVLEAFPK